MSSGCGDVLSLEDLKVAKKHQLFEAEVITGLFGGVAGGAPIDYATNQNTGQTQKTLPAVLRDAGFQPASFNFTTGGTLGANDANKAVLWPIPDGGDGNYYRWKGALPKTIPASSTPNSTGGISDSAWSPVTDVTLRQELLSPASPYMVVADNVSTAAPSVTFTRSQLEKNYDVVSVKDFGAKGDGVADDSDAIQTMFDAIAAAQQPFVSPSHMYRRALAYFPEGRYKITRVIKVRGCPAIVGVGTAYTAGSVIAQETADTDIFNFYGETFYNLGLGVLVQGLNFMFPNSAGSRSGYALRFPLKNDISLLNQFSNSHYVRDNRFGGAESYGSFLFVEASNDVEISRNIIDTAIYSANPVIQLGSQGNLGIGKYCSDVRIFGNNFFMCSTSIRLVYARSTFIGNNTFSNAQSGAQAVQIASDTGTSNVGAVNGTLIANNNFWAQWFCFTTDASGTNTSFNGNTATDCYSYPIQLNGVANVQRLRVLNNTIHLANAFDSGASSGTYGNTNGFMASIFARLDNAEVSNNTVDVNGLTLVRDMFVDIGGASLFNSSCRVSNNRLVGATALDGASYTLLPISQAKISASTSASGAYVSAAPVFFVQIGASESAELNIDYRGDYNKSGVEAGNVTGRIVLSIIRAPNGSIISEFKPVSSAAGTVSGTVANNPAVTLQLITVGGALAIAASITSPVAAPTTSSIIAQVTGGFCSGVPVIKSA